MGALFEILMYSLSSLFWGIVFTALGMALLFFLIKSFYPKSTFTPISLCIGGILFILLSFQATLIGGAVKIKSMDEEIEWAINRYIPESWRYADREISVDDSQQLVENLGAEYALFGHYINLAEFQGFTANTIAEAMVDEMHVYLNAFLLRRVGWSLFFVLLGGFLVIRTLGMQANLRRSHRRTAASRRRTHDF